MDAEFHYYSLYLILRAVGLDNNTSAIIAYSSQYTDDNYTEYNIRSNSGEIYRNQCSAIMDPIAIMLGYGDTILQNFHFIIGEHRLHPKAVTRDSPKAQSMLSSALQTRCPYLLGIALHAYADTWAHENFIGGYDAFNGKAGIFESVVPNIGHADFGILPDLVGVCWYDKRFAKHVDNNVKFLECAATIFDKLHEAFNLLAQSRADIAKKQVLSVLGKIYSNSAQYSLLRHIARSKRRIGLYQKAVEHCYHDYLPIYDNRSWFQQGVRIIGDDYYFRSEIEECDNQHGHWFNFQEAVKKFNAIQEELCKNF